jgi:sugar lactone lactonase YvrE
VTYGQQQQSPTLNAYPITAQMGKPTARIYGRQTDLYDPMAIAMDGAGNVYVSNRGARSVTVYAAAHFGHGDAPIRRIRGLATGLYGPSGVAIDASGNVYVANQGGQRGRADSVNVYAAGATGNVKPMREIRGFKTGLALPTGVAFDSAGNLYVANITTSGNTGSITVYAAGATGDAIPIRTISGANTQLAFWPSAVAFDASGNLYVANPTSGAMPSITVYAPGSNGNVAPVQIIEGEKTGLRDPTSVAVDSAGDVFVGDSSYDGLIYEFVAGLFGDNYPTQTIDGFDKYTHLETLVSGVLAR